MEKSTGYGITPIRFASGHVLALRVVRRPEPRTEVWHRPPGGRAWTVHHDGTGGPDLPDMDTGGAVTVVRATVRASWSGGRVVRVGVAEAGLEWTLRLRSSPLTRLANARPSRVSLEVHGEEDPLRVLLRVGRTGEDRPIETVVDGAGPRAVVHPHRLLVVGAAHAELGGRELGRPAFTREPLLGGLFPWRAPGILVEGEMWTRAPEATTTSPGIGIALGRRVSA